MGADADAATGKFFPVRDFKVGTKVIFNWTYTGNLKAKGFRNGIVIEDNVDYPCPNGAVGVRFYDHYNNHQEHNMFTRYITPTVRRRLSSTSSATLNRIRRLRRRLAFETSEYEKY